MHEAVRVIENQWIELPDGRRLAARLWMPDGEGPFPAILEYLPYRKRDGTAPRDETTYPVFARRGYVGVRVDIAGTGDSEGRFDDEYSEQELCDGEAVLAWVAQQDWCDGNVGMIGISWGGFNGLQLAFRRPKALKAIVTVASTVDRYADDIHYMGGCLLSDNVNWAAQMFAYLSRPADPELRPDWREDWIERMVRLPFSAADWLRHPTRDPFWKHGSVREDPSRIEVPVLSITGWADAYVNAPPWLAESLDSPTKALIGPWEHRYPHISKLEASDFHGEVLGWFDRWLRGQPNGAGNWPAYRTFMQEHFSPTAKNSPRAGRWIAEWVWPSPNITSRTLHLAPGELVERPSESDIKIATPAHVGLASGYFCAGMRVDNELPGDQSEDDGLSVCFDTEVLDVPLELMGRAQFRFAFTVTTPTAQIVARLCDVAPDGVSQRISYRPLNLSHRASQEHPEPLVPGRRYTAVLRLNECAHRLRSGHRLRLALSSSYWPIVWPVGQPTEITLHLEDCRLVLPVRQVETEIDPKAPATARDYPVLDGRVFRQPTSQSRREILEDGTMVLETSDDYGQMEDPYHGLIVGSSVTMRYGIHPDNPASARLDAAWSFTFKRGDWQVAIDTENTMTCDSHNFHLRRRLRATEGEDLKEVLSKDWSETISRGLL